MCNKIYYQVMFKPQNGDFLRDFNGLYPLKTDFSIDYSGKLIWAFLFRKTHGLSLTITELSDKILSLFLANFSIKLTQLGFSSVEITCLLLSHTRKFSLNVKLYVLYMYLTSKHLLLAKVAWVRT